MAKVKHYNSGYYDLRRAPGVIADLESRGKRVLKAVDPKGSIGYATSSTQGQKRPQGRWIVTVYTKSRYAKRHNVKHNALVKALDAARGG